MFKETIVKLLGSLALVILLCLPVAVAQQAELTLTRVTGSSTNRPGFYKPDEGITIEATASIAADFNGIQAEQLRLYIDGNRNAPFQSCQAAEGIRFACKLTTGTSPAPGSHDFEVRLFNDADRFIDTAPPVLSRRQRLTSDVLGAQGIEVIVIPGQTKDGKVQIRHTVIDRALDITPPNVCVGIDAIDLILDDATNAPFATITGDGTCRMQTVTSQTFPSLSNGVHTIIIRARDRFGQVGPLAPAAFVMDNSVPDIQPGAVTITDSDIGSIVTFVRSDRVTFADVEIKLTKANLTPSKVRADFSQISTSSGFTDRTADTIKDFTATWKRVPIIGLRTCSIRVTATDNVGNTASATISCDVRNDDSGPAVASMETTVKGEDGTFFIGKNGALIITFTDEGSGVNATTAFAGLADLIGRSPAPANQCDASGTTYRCIWNITATKPDGKKTVTAHRRTTDLLGNPLQSEKSLSLVLDTTAPIITSVTQRLIEGPSGGVGVPIQGSSLEFTLNGTGFSPALVRANLTALGGPEASSLSCGEKTCTTIASVSTSGPFDATVTFTAGDAAGNEAKAKLVVPIAGTLNETPNFWTTSATCTPLVDRSTTSLIQHKVFCDANLASSNPNARPLAINFRGIASCTGDVSKKIASVDAFNLEAQSRHPTFGLTLFAAEYNIDQLVATCPLEITTLVNNSGKIFVTTTPEIEDVAMTIQFYNLPLSEMDKNIGQQVDDAVKDAKENLAFIGTLEKFFEFASRICNLKVILTNLMSAFNALKNLVGGASLFSLPGTPTREALRAHYTKVCEGEQGASDKHENMFGFLDQLCSFVNCRATQEDAAGDGAGSYLAKLGGGAAHCKELQARLAAIGGAEGVNIPDVRNKYTYLGGMGQSIDVKNSLIMSTLCLCVPGIIHNVNKLREVKCQYALCMAREVKEGGLPPSYCKNLQSYLYCNYIVGDVFSILPIFRLWDQTMNILKNIYANPFEAIPALIGLKCRTMCQTPETLAAHNSCILPKTLAKIGDAIGSVRSIQNIQDYFTPGSGGFCQQLEELTAENQTTTNSTTSNKGYGLFG